MHHFSDIRHRIVAGIAAMSLCVGAASEVDAQLLTVGSDAVRPSAPAEAVTNEPIGKMMAQRKSMLDRSLIVRFVGSGGREYHATSLRLADHPDWLMFDGKTEEMVVHKRMVLRFIGEASDEFLTRPRIAVAFPQEDDELRVRIEGEARAGFSLNEADAAQRIADAFMNAHETVDIPVTYAPPTVLLSTENGFQELTLLSRGLSDFEGSPSGRASNIRKSLNDQLDGIIVRPGESFSFNKAMLGNSGWSNALVIGPGGVLTPEPGGGICQAATTVYRAALLAGLPVLKRANHSLYVTYYEKFGVGLDATVYADKQDLTFMNDMASPVVMTARHEGAEARVELYGTPDGRSAALQGPFFADTAHDPLFAEKPLRINQIGWTYEVTFADGTMKKEPIVSTYKAIPKRLKAEFSKRSATGTVVYAE